MKRIPRILMKLLGFQHVPDRTVQVIYRWGRYHRAVSSTFTRHWPLIESFGPQLPIEIRAIDRLYKDVMSRDGVLYEIRVSAKAFFNMSNALSTVAPVLVQRGSAIIDGRMSSLVEAALRREVRRLHSSALLAPDTPAHLEDTIRETLAKNLKIFGASLLAVEDGLVVKEILPPQRMQENRTENINIAETIEGLGQHAAEKIMQAIYAQLMRDLGSNKPQFKTMYLPDSLNPTTGNARDEDSLRILRRPTGHLYNN